MRKIIVSLLNCFIVTLLLTITVCQISLAAESTSSAVSDEEVKDKIKEKLEEVVEKGLDKVKGLVTEEVENRLFAWVGIISEINDDNLSIETNSGLKEAQIASNAAMFKVNPGKPRTAITKNDLTKDLYIIAMGPKTDEQILAKRILTMDKAPQVVKRILIAGKVKEIDDPKVTFQTNGDTWIVSISNEIKFNILGIKKPTIEDIQVGDLIKAVVVLDNDKIKATKVVLVIPGNTSPQSSLTPQEEEATPSAATPIK